MRYLIITRPEEERKRLLELLETPIYGPYSNRDAEVIKEYLEEQGYSVKMSEPNVREGL